MGRENIPIPVYNGTDDEPLPTDYQYVTANVETADLHINRTISSLQVKFVGFFFMPHLEALCFINS